MSHKTNWRKISLWSIGVVVGVVFLLLDFIAVALQVEYSPGRHTKSSATSKEHGRFVAAPIVRDSTVVGPYGNSRVVDAWIEQDTHVESVALFFYRTVFEDAYTLIVAFAESGHASNMQHLGIVWPHQSRIGVEDTVSLFTHTGTTSRRIVERNVERPFPDSIRFVLFKPDQFRDTTKSDLNPRRRIVSVLPPVFQNAQHD